LSLLERQCVVASGELNRSTSAFWSFCLAWPTTMFCIVVLLGTVMAYNRRIVRLAGLSRCRAVRSSYLAKVNGVASLTLAFRPFDVAHRRSNALLQLQRRSCFFFFFFSKAALLKH
jgi:hypothetical protein